MHPNSTRGKIGTMLGFLRAIIKAIWIKEELFRFRFMFQGNKKKEKEKERKEWRSEIQGKKKNPLNSNVFDSPMRRTGINSGTQLQ